MELQCPHCHQRYDVDEAYLGRQIQCEWCHNWFVLESDHDSSKDEPQLEPPPVTQAEQEIKEDHSSSRTCPLCGGEIPADVKKCRHCGGWLDKRDDPSHRLTYTILAVFLGVLGVHNFFAGEKLAGFGHIISLILTVIMFAIGENTQGGGGIPAAFLVFFINMLWALLEAITGREVRIKNALLIFLGIIGIAILCMILVSVIRMGK